MADILWSHSNFLFSLLLTTVFLPPTVPILSRPSVFSWLLCSTSHMDSLPTSLHFTPQCTWHSWHSVLKYFLIFPTWCCNLLVSFPSLATLSKYIFLVNYFCPVSKFWHTSWFGHGFILLLLCLLFQWSHSLTQIYISNYMIINSKSVFQIQTSELQIWISTWICQRHCKFNISKYKHIS